LLKKRSRKNHNIETTDTAVLNRHRDLKNSAQYFERPSRVPLAWPNDKNTIEMKQIPVASTTNNQDKHQRQHKSSKVQPQRSAHVIVVYGDVTKEEYP
jgi:hypothetical protein